MPDIRGGRFDQEAMLALIEESSTPASARLRIERLWANMEWALEIFGRAPISSSTRPD